jgi:hypothetical protein
MSQIKPKQGVVYECYKGFTDEFGDRARVGQKFILEDDQPQELIDFNGYYVMQKSSGRGTSIAAPISNFASYFIPAAGQDEQTETKFKVGDKVRIVKSSDWYGVEGDWNPIDTDGIIKEIKDEDLGIIVRWANDEINSYNERDLVLVGAEQKSYIDDNQLKQYSMKAIVVSSLEQIKELAKVSFLKDQIESEFPELFVTHKVGNRYKHSDGNRYILTGENSHVALTNLKTGMIESHTVRVDNFDKITADEFSELCRDYKELTLIKERQ